MKAATSESGRVVPRLSRAAVVVVSVRKVDA